MSVISGIMGANAATNAAQTTADANTANSDKALVQQKDLYNQEVARNKPFYDSGVTANANLGKMVNGGYSVQQSPAAQYELQQGSRSLNRNLAARGLLGSGNAAQRMSELSGGVAAKDYNDQYSRLLDQVKIGTGASASAGASSNTLSNAIGQNSQQVQNSNNQLGQSRAALYSGAGGVTTSMANTGINAYRSGLFNTAAGGATADATISAGGAAADANVADYMAAL